MWARPSGPSRFSTCCCSWPFDSSSTCPALGPAARNGFGPFALKIELFSSWTQPSRIGLGSISGAPRPAGRIWNSRLASPAAALAALALAPGIGVAIVLLLGLINMMRGDSGNTSQKLMRLRVVLQFVAIVIIMVTIWVMAK